MSNPPGNLVTADYPQGIQSFDPSSNNNPPNSLSIAQISSISSSLVSATLNSSSTINAIANVTAIQAALSGRGLVRLIGSGVIYVHTSVLPLIIDSNTDFQIDPKLTVRQIGGGDGHARSMLVSRQFVNRAGTAVTLSWTNGTSFNTCSVAWTAHGKVIGDYIWIQNAAPSAFNGIFQVRSVTNANAIVITLYRLPPANGAFHGNVPAASTTLHVTSVEDGGLEIGQTIAGSGITAGTYIAGFSPGATGGTGDYILSQIATVGSNTALTTTSPGLSGAAIAVTVDVNVFVSGGTWDYDFPNNVNNIGAGLGDLLGGYLMILAGENLHARDINVINSQAQTIAMGACRNYSMENISTPNTSSGGPQIHGNSFNGFCKSISGSGGDDGFSITARMQDDFIGYRWSVGDILDCTTENINWNSAVGGLVTIYPTVAEKTDNITVRRVTGSNGAAGLYGVNIFNWETGDHCGLVTIEDVNVVSDAAVSVHGHNGAVGIIDKLVVRGITYNPYTNASVAFFQDATTTILDADFDILADVPAAQLNSPYLYLLTGPFGHISVKCTTVTGGSSELLRAVRLTSTGGGANAQLVIHDCQSTILDQFATIDAGATLGLMVFRNNNIDSPSVLGCSGNVTVAFEGNKINNASLGVIRLSGSPNITVKSDGTNVLTGTSTWFAVFDTPTISIYGWDITADPLALTGLATTAGQYLKSSRASAINQGPTVKTAAGWVALATGVAGVNTVIT